MNTPETDVIGGPYIDEALENPIMSFKPLTNPMTRWAYQRWIYSLPQAELERREEIVKQQLDNNNSGSIITS